MTVSFEWGNFSGAAGRNLGVTVLILESDGSFVPEEEMDVLGASGVRVVGQQSIEMLNAADGQTSADEFKFSLSGVGVNKTLFLRFNNYDPSGSNNDWVALDNVSVSATSRPRPALFIVKQ